MRTILAGGLITQLSGCQYFLCAIIMEIKDAQNIGSSSNGNFNFLTVVNRLKPGQSFSHYKNLAVSFHTSREDVILTMHHDISLSCQKLMRATGILIILGKIMRNSFVK